MHLFHFPLRRHPAGPAHTDLLRHHPGGLRLYPAAAGRSGDSPGRRARRNPGTPCRVDASARFRQAGLAAVPRLRSEEHTSELQSLMRISYAVFCLKKKTNTTTKKININ